jgi:hypothetical protein
MSVDFLADTTPPMHRLEQACLFNHMCTRVYSETPTTSLFAGRSATILRNKGRMRMVLNICIHA